MATKTFEELKQLAIQIRDEKTNKANTATRIGTQMIEHLNKLEQEYYNKDGVAEQLKTRDDELARLDKMTTEYNVSVLHPTSGSGGSNKYTLETAIVQVPSKYRSIGIKCAFINESGKPECWKYQGGSWVAASFVKEADGGNKILEWKTDAATTRKQVALSERKAGMQISYTPDGKNWVNEQYIGKTLTDAEWGKDGNWVIIPNIGEVVSVVTRHPYTGGINLLDNVEWTDGHFAWEGAPEDSWTNLIPVVGNTWLILDINEGGNSKHSFSYYDSKQKLISTKNEFNRSGVPYYVDNETAYIQIVQTKAMKPYANVYAFNTYADAIAYIEKRTDKFNKVNNAVSLSDYSYNASGKKQKSLFGEVFDVQYGDTVIVIYKNVDFLSEASGRVNFLSDTDECVKTINEDNRIGIMYEYHVDDIRIKKCAINYHEGTINQNNIDDIRKWGIYVYIEREIKQAPFVASYINKIRNKKNSFIMDSIDISDYPFAFNDLPLAKEGESFVIDGTSAGRIAITVQKLHEFLLDKSMDYVIPNMSYPGGYAGITYSLECLVTNKSDADVTLSNNILDYIIVQPNAEVRCFNGDTTQYTTGLNTQLFILEFPKASLRFRKPKVHFINMSKMDKFKSSIQGDYNKFYKVPFHETDESVAFARYAKGIQSMIIKPKMVTFGDSSMVSHTVSVPLLIAKRYNLQLVDCSQWGSVPLHIEGAEKVWELSDEKLANVDSSTGLVIIQGGLNWGKNVNNGEFKDGEEESRDRKTLYGCINYAVDYILEKSPDCIIVLCTVQTSFYTTGQGIADAPGTVERWNNVYKNIAAKRNLVLADLANSLIPTVQNRLVFYNDEVHPKITACLRWAACINNELQKVLF